MDGKRKNKRQGRSKAFAVMFGGDRKGSSSDLHLYNHKHPSLSVVSSLHVWKYRRREMPFLHSSVINIGHSCAW